MWNGSREEPRVSAKWNEDVAFTVLGIAMSGIANTGIMKHARCVTRALRTHLVGDVSIFYDCHRTTRF